VEHSAGFQRHGVPAWRLEIFIVPLSTCTSMVLTVSLVPAPSHTAGDIRVADQESYCGPLTVSEHHRRGSSCSCLQFQILFPALDKTADQMARRSAASKADSSSWLVAAC